MNSKVIARFGIIIALIAAAYHLDAAITMVIPFLGATIRIAASTIVVTLTFCQLFDFKTAVFTTTVFGLFSFLFAYIYPNITSPAFMNPLISIFPRVMIGVVSFNVYKLAKRILKDKQSDFVSKLLPRAIGAASGVLTNTILVVSMIAIVGDQSVLTKLIGVIISFNFISEILCGIFVVPILAESLSKKNLFKKIS